MAYYQNYNVMIKEKVRLWLITLYYVRHAPVMWQLSKLDYKEKLSIYLDLMSIGTMRQPTFLVYIYNYEWFFLLAMYWICDYVLIYMHLISFY